MVNITVLDSNAEINASELEARTGVLLFTIPTENYEDELDKICKERGYVNRDEIKLHKDIPDLESKLEVFFTEHLHDDEEIRYILDGEGYFDVRDKDSDEWLRIHVQKDDLLIMPKERYHRFTLTDSRSIHAMRLFQDDPKWTPLYRKDREMETESASASSSSSSSTSALSFNHETLAAYGAPVHFDTWLQANKGDLKPPVGNKLMWGAGDFKVMIVGGPNVRSDYHIEDGEEYFYQLKGDMVLKVVDNGEFKDIPIKEGEMFLLPGNIPHSPQRKSDTVGLVMERERREGELDGLRWYCDNEDCRQILYEEFFHCTDLGTQLKPVIEKFYSSDELRTCKACGHTSEKPTAPEGW